MTTKGKLGEPEAIGFYTKRIEKIDNVPPRPNEIQMSVITSIIKKVNYVIKPLNDEAFHKLVEQEKQLGLRKIKRSGN